MSKTVALVTAGPVRPELLVRLPKLLRALGPVKASTYQQASRVANSLRHGTAVRAWDPVAACRTVLVSTGEEGWAETERALVSVRPDLHGLLAIYLGNPRDFQQSAAVQAGARVAAATLIPGTSPVNVLVVGSQEAARLLRSMGARVAHVSAMDPGRHEAALDTLGWLIPQALTLAASAFIDAGIPPGAARAITGAYAAEAARGFLRTSRKPDPDAGLKALAARQAPVSGMP